MSTAKQNIAKLPEYCYSILPTDLSLIRIKAGAMGYYPCKEHNPSNKDLEIEFKHPILNREDRLELLQRFVDDLNAYIGVNPQQAEAMSAGSMWGWEVPAADPDNYDENGKFKEECLIAKE